MNLPKATMDPVQVPGAEFSFLNLEDCSGAERDQILNILNKSEAAPQPSCFKNETNGKFSVAASTEEQENYNHHLGHTPNHGELPQTMSMPHIMAQPPMYDHQTGMTLVSSMAEYQTPMDASVMTSANGPTPGHTFGPYSSTMPHVYINQVTANVNVHHGPTQLQDDPQQQHQRHQMMAQGHPQALHPHQAVPPPASQLPTPQFPPANQQGVYIPPFTSQHGMNIAKGGQMYNLPMMYGMYNNYPYPMMGVMPQPGMPRGPIPMMRGQTPHPGTPMYPPPMMAHFTMPDMSQFAAPPPVPVVPPVIPDVAHVPIVPQPIPPVQPQLIVQSSSQPQLVAESEQPEPEKKKNPVVEPEMVEPEGVNISFGFEVPLEIEENKNKSVVAEVEQGQTEKESKPNENEIPPQEEKTPVKSEDETAKQESALEEPHSSIPATKSWASLFHCSSQANNAGGEFSAKPTALIHPYTGEMNDKNLPGNQNRADHFSGGQGLISLGRKEAKMADFLLTYCLNHKAQSLKPRGLSNRSNWCFVNAIMQALVACPPFFNMMKALPEGLVAGEKSNEENLLKSPMKILAACNSFVAEFAQLENFPKLNRKDKNKKPEDLPLDKTFEAASIFQVLLNLNSETFNVIEGRQEDAEEFLTFLLNGLNDEMVSILKLVTPSQNQDEEVRSGNLAKSEASGTEDDEWQEVQRGPKNKSCVTRRGGDLGSSVSGLRTPIADMFQGQVRSSVSRGVGDISATLQPFFTLQLDIQSEGIKNVSDALNHNFTTETLDGYVCSKTKLEMEASRSLLLEELPPVLILHLKRFVYDIKSGGCQKLLKNIDFPVDLEIPKDILSPSSRNKYLPRQRSYKLFAIVYHNGTEATKGHYVADVYHTGLSSWLHCDDSSLKSISENMVLAHSASSMPYILFYRRGDTMGGGGGSDKTKGNTNTSSSNKNIG